MKIIHLFSGCAGLAAAFTPLTTLEADCVQPPANMIAWWTGDSNNTDIRGGHDGTRQNGATFGTGEVAQGFSFDGSDDYVDVGTVNLPATLTIDAWINVTDLSDVRTIIAND